ncbi:putative oxidoreductase [Lachnellula subtilissima]|uniref:Putative oxidoreductase n=1 Tax=Lachnellula subtilissima TaxID=602034 RepID=A0A8H8RNF1_9HELO|nr:putative oxidoreductase [Lachnellula subtilissima]
MATKGISFNPTTDIPSLDGKVILITGANSGLGKQAFLELAKHKPALIWMAARSPEKGNEAVADVKRQVPGVAVKLLELDLSSFDSIKKAARTVLEESSRLDILMLNAGLMGCPPALTKDGYEIQMGTNHIGQALLLKLLTPLLLKTANSHPVRIISLASSAWKYAGPEKIQFQTLKSVDASRP